MNLIDFITSYPAVVVTVTSLSAVFLTILTADKAKSRKGFLSDLMMEDRSSMFFMSVGMIIASILTPLTIIRFDLGRSDSLSLYSYIVLVSTVFFFITPIFLWLGRYSWHLVSIRLYFISAFIAEFLIILDVGSYWPVAAILVSSNLVLTVGAFNRGKIRSLPEIIFFVLTLIYLLILNGITNGII